MTDKEKLEYLRDKVLNSNIIPLKPSELVEIITAKSYKKVKKILKKYAS